MDAEALGTCSAADLADAIQQWHAVAVSMHRELLRFIREFDRREEWRADGATSMAAWLAYRLQVSFHTASEWVRVARALPELPAIASLAEAGALSWDQLAPLTRLATPDTDLALAEEAPRCSAAVLRRMARRARALTVEETQSAHERRYVSWAWSFDDTSVRIQGRLPADGGAALVELLEDQAHQLPIQAADDVAADSFGARCADVLMGLAQAQLAETADSGGAHTVVTHIDHDAIAADGPQGGELDHDGPTLHPETVRRLSCDSRLEVVIDGPDGTPVGVGRSRRTIPAWMRRQLRRRDGGCVWPGCGRTRWLQAHHIVHWSHGGPTDLGNLGLLCAAHHRLVHEGGYELRGDPSQGFTVHRRDGTSVTRDPPTDLTALRQRLLALLPLAS